MEPKVEKTKRDPDFLGFESAQIVFCLFFFFFWFWGVGYVGGSCIRLELVAPFGGGSRKRTHRHTRMGFPFLLGNLKNKWFSVYTLKHSKASVPRTTDAHGAISLSVKGDTPIRSGCWG